MAKKILFIDSDEAFAQGLSQAAQGRGHTGLVSTNSEQGITLARQEAPDLIVVCVEAQPTNGYMLCTRLKKDDRLKSIPVILTSANATQDSFEKHKKLKTRAEEYLIKPFDAAALFAKANPLLGLAAEAEEVVEMQDEPLGMGLNDLVATQDEPIRIGDNDLVGGAQDEGFLVDEVEEVVQLDDQGTTSEGDPDLQMFDKAFDALEVPGAGHDHPDTMPIQTASPSVEVAEEVVALSAEAAHEAKSGAPASPAANSDGEKSIDDLLGSLETPPSVVAELSTSGSAELESRILNLEQELAARTAELESVKAQAPSGTAEIARLKEHRTRQDKEILRLKEELHNRERELIEIQDAQTQLEAQVQSSKDEAIKRDAAAKALQQRAEALAAAAKKFERELSAARTELKELPAVKARLAELEKVAGETPKKLAEAQAELERSHARAADLEREVANVRDMTATELAGARELHAQEVTQVRGELTAAQHELGKANEELNALRTDVARLNGDLEAIRAELQTVSGEKELLSDEREELKKAVAEAQAAAVQNEERAVKAYQKIKGDERLRERTKKALTIALQLLDEAPAIEALDEDVEPAKQSA